MAKGVHGVAKGVHGVAKGVHGVASWVAPYIHNKMAIVTKSEIEIFVLLFFRYCSVDR